MWPPTRLGRSSGQAWAVAAVGMVGGCPGQWDPSQRQPPQRSPSPRGLSVFGGWIRGVAAGGSPPSAGERIPAFLCPRPEKGRGRGALDPGEAFSVMGAAGRGLAEVAATLMR